MDTMAEDEKFSFHIRYDALFLTHSLGLNILILIVFSYVSCSFIYSFVHKQYKYLLCTGPIPEAEIHGHTWSSSSSKTMHV